MKAFASVYSGGDISAELKAYIYGLAQQAWIGLITDKANELLALTDNGKKVYYSDTITDALREIVETVGADTYTGNGEDVWTLAYAKLGAILPNTQVKVRHDAMGNYDLAAGDDRNAVWIDGIYGRLTAAIAAATSEREVLDAVTTAIQEIDDYRDAHPTV
jgi:hypothetical protein